MPSKRSNPKAKDHAPAKEQAEKKAAQARASAVEEGQAPAQVVGERAKPIAMEGEEDNDNEGDLETCTAGQDGSDDGREDIDETEKGREDETENGRKYGREDGGEEGIEEDGLAMTLPNLWAKMVELEKQVEVLLLALFVLRAQTHTDVY